MKNSAKTLTRRNLLRGAGVALALPWMESLEPRRARGQTALPRRRFVAMTFPCGVSNFWTPTGVGAGNAWQLSPILAPLAPIKEQVSVLSHVGNYSPWGGHVEPSHANLCGAFLTCTKPSGPQDANGGTSVDQVIAQTVGSATRIPSLQVGLSTLDSYTDGLAGQFSRSISWASPSEPLYKLVDPQKVFDKMFGSLPTADTRAADKSVLDQVVAQASSMQATLSKSDGVRLDEFLTSVRAVETNIAGLTFPAVCTTATRPTESINVGAVPADYNRDTHANIMIDLVTLALQCDLTRIITFMMDDARSDFVYDFLTMRTFSPAGSVPATGPIAGLHGLTAAGDANSGWATINFWFVQKLTRLCQNLMAIEDGAGGTLLDQSLVWFGTEMHGGNHDGLDLPLLYVGGGGGRFKVGEHFDFSARPRQSEDLANVYLTFIRKMFDLPDTSFGTGVGDYVDAGRQIVPEIVV